MATSIGKLSLQLSADASELERDLGKAEEKAKGFGERVGRALDALKSGASAGKLASGVEGFAGRAQAALGTVRTATDLVRGNVATLGQGLGAMGEIAGAVAGPWGLAAGAILAAGGAIIDFLQGPLIRAQAAAREGFMSVATGARTVEQAMGDLRLGALQDSLDRMVQIHQLAEQVGTGRAVQAATFGVAGQSPAEAVPNLVQRAVNQTRMRRDAMRALLNNGAMTELRGEMAGEQAAQQLQDMTRGARLRVATRALMSATRGEAGRGGISPTTAARMIAEERFRSQGLEPTARQQRALERQARQTAHALQAEGSVNAMERTAEGIDAQNEAMAQQIRNFGLTAREAQAADAQNEVYRRHQALLTAQTFGLSDAEQARARRLLAQAQAGLREMRVRDEVLTRQEAADRLRQETVAGGAQVAFLREQAAATGAQFRFVVDMTREQAELDRLRLRGADAWRVALAEANLEATRAVRQQQMLAQAGLQTMRQNQNPVERFDEAIARADRLLTSGNLSARDYGREVERAVREFEAMNPTEHGAGGAMAFGSREALAAVARNNRRLEGEPQRRAEAIRQHVAAMRETMRNLDRNMETTARELARGGARVFLAAANFGG